MMIEIEKPNITIVGESEDGKKGKFVIEPLERGYGMTLGNALRRVLLSSIPGASMYAIEVEGARHEFSALEGIREDVTSIVLNLKGLILKINDDDNVKKELKISVKGPKVVTAADIVCPGDVEIINKDQVIATIAKGGKLDMEFIVANGRGYVPSVENKKYIEDQKIGFIPIDALYSPIERISYEIDNARVGQDASYDKLIMEVFTNGSIRPEEAMALAAKIMIEHLNIVTNLSEIADVTGIMNAKQEDSKLKKLETSIDDLDFSVRAYNCLKRAGVNTLGDLTAKSEVEMMKIRNLGKKSLKEVIDKIKDMGLRFREDD